MSRPDVLEIVLNDQMVARAETSFAPAPGETINIRMQRYRVRDRNYVLDNSEHPAERQMVCVVTVEKARS